MERCYRIYQRHFPLLAGSTERKMSLFEFLWKGTSETWIYFAPPNILSFSQRINPIPNIHQILLLKSRFTLVSKIESLLVSYRLVVVVVLQSERYCWDSLLALHVNDNHSPSPELKIVGLKKLKTLKLCKLAQLDNLVGIDVLLELRVTHVQGSELKEYDLSKSTQRFKDLQKCVMCVQCVSFNDPTKEYIEIVENIFQNSGQDRPKTKYC